MNKFALLLSSILLCSLTATAEENISVEHTSPNHTKIVIHNTSPEAFRLRNEQAREAQRRLEEKRQRKHQLELARLEAEERQAKAQAQARAQQQQQPKIYRKKEYQPAPFMNGGIPTMGFGFGGVPYGGYAGYGGFAFAPRSYGFRGNRSCGPRYRGVRRSYAPRARCGPRRSYRPAVRAGNRGRRCR